MDWCEGDVVKTVQMIFMIWEHKCVCVCTWYMSFTGSLVQGGILMHDPVDMATHPVGKSHAPIHVHTFRQKYCLCNWRQRIMLVLSLFTYGRYWDGHVYFTIVRQRTHALCICKRLPRTFDENSESLYTSRYFLTIHCICSLVCRVRAPEIDVNTLHGRIMACISNCARWKVILSHISLHNFCQALLCYPRSNIVCLRFMDTLNVHAPRRYGLWKWCVHEAIEGNRNIGTWGCHGCCGMAGGDLSDDLLLIYNKNPEDLRKHVCGERRHLIAPKGDWRRREFDVLSDQSWSEIRRWMRGHGCSHDGPTICKQKSGSKSLGYHIVSQ